VAQVEKAILKQAAEIPYLAQSHQRVAAMVVEQQYLV
jgi:hypothetical protein